MSTIANTTQSASFVAPIPNTEIREATIASVKKTARKKSPRKSNKVKATDRSPRKSPTKKGRLLKNGQHQSTNKRVKSTKKRKNESFCSQESDKSSVQMLVTQGSGKKPSDPKFVNLVQQHAQMSYTTGERKSVALSGDTGGNYFSNAAVSQADSQEKNKPFLKSGKPD